MIFQIWTPPSSPELDFVSISSTRSRACACARVPVDPVLLGFPRAFITSRQETELPSLDLRPVASKNRSSFLSRDRASVAQSTKEERDRCASEKFGKLLPVYSRCTVIPEIRFRFFFGPFCVRIVLAGPFTLTQRRFATTVSGRTRINVGRW